LAALQQQARQEAAVLRSGCRLAARAECRVAADHQDVRVVEMEAARHSPAEQPWAPAAASSLLTAVSVPVACRSARSQARLVARLRRPADARAVRFLRLAAARADAAARWQEAAAAAQQVAEAAWDARAPPEVAAGQAVSAAPGRQPEAAAQDAAVPQRVVVVARDAAAQRAAVAPDEAVQPVAAAEPGVVGLRLAAPGVAGQHQAWALPWAWAFRPGRLRREGARPGQRRTARSAHEKSSLQGASPKGRSWQAARDEG
jgi:hypothetical protein